MELRALPLAPAPFLSPPVRSSFSLALASLPGQGLSASLGSAMPRTPPLLQPAAERAALGLGTSSSGPGISNAVLAFAASAVPLELRSPAKASGSAGGITASALRVAYQGVPGAYSEMAAKKAYPDCSPVPCSQFDDAFLAVEQWLVDRAVLPIENSLGGSIHRNYDLLLRHRLHIVGEVQLPVNHCLLALPGQDIASLTRVMSHPQALAQVENTLSRLGTMTREAVDDTAGAAKMIAQGKLEGVGAVASSRAAEMYGLEILAEGIQDDSDNITRFLVLAREPILPDNVVPFKTSIVFTLEEGPGVLFKALSVFALRDINLTKIESRPQRDKPLLQQHSHHPRQHGESSRERENEPSTGIYIDSVLSRPAPNGNGDSSTRQERGGESTTAASVPQGFDYLFYIDFQASLAERRAQNALRHLQEFAPFLRVLGSYPMDHGGPVEDGH